MVERKYHDPYVEQLRDHGIELLQGSADTLTIHVTDRLRELFERLRADCTIEEARKMVKRLEPDLRTLQVRCEQTGMDKRVIRGFSALFGAVAAEFDRRQQDVPREDDVFYKYEFHGLSGILRRLQPSPESSQVAQRIAKAACAFGRMLREVAWLNPITNLFAKGLDSADEIVREQVQKAREAYENTKMD